MAGGSLRVGSVFRPSWRPGGWRRDTQQGEGEGGVDLWRVDGRSERHLRGPYFSARVDDEDLACGNADRRIADKILCRVGGRRGGKGGQVDG